MVYEDHLPEYSQRFHCYFRATVWVFSSPGGRHLDVLVLGATAAKRNEPFPIPTDMLGIVTAKFATEKEEKELRSADEVIVLQPAPQPVYYW